MTRSEKILERHRDQTLESTLGGSSLVYMFDEVDSTQDIAKSLLEESPGSEVIVVANSQKAGRGRSQRVWRSPAGQGLYFTYGYSRKSSAKELAGFSPTIGLALLNGLREHLGASGEGILLKWPNDLVWKKDRSLKKLGGVLIEVSSSGRSSESSSAPGESVILIGVGINVSGEILDLEGKHTSIEMIGGKTHRSVDILPSLVKSIKRSVAKFNESGFEVFQADWNANAVSYEGEVKVCLNSSGSDSVNEFVGKIEGINIDGSLGFRSSHGQLKAIYSGELPFDSVCNDAQKVSGRIVSEYYKVK